MLGTSGFLEFVFNKKFMQAGRQSIRPEKQTRGKTAEDQAFSDKDHVVSDGFIYVDAKQDLEKLIWQLCVEEVIGIVVGHASVKTYQIICLKLLNFIVCKLYTRMAN